MTVLRDFAAALTEMVGTILLVVLSCIAAGGLWSWATRREQIVWRATEQRWVTSRRHTIEVMRTRDGVKPVTARIWSPGGHLRSADGAHRSGLPARPASRRGIPGGHPI
jgi:hypothetical protein